MAAAVSIGVGGELLGRPAHEDLILSQLVTGCVGGNSISANLFASVIGAFMYFAMLTEVPIPEVLIGSGMGKDRHLLCISGDRRCRC